MHVLPMYAWVLSSYCGFLPPYKNMYVKLQCSGCLSLCGPVMDWQLVQGIPSASRLMTAGIGLGGYR